MQGIIHHLISGFHRTTRHGTHKIRPYLTRSIWQAPPWGAGLFLRLIPRVAVAPCYAHPLPLQAFLFLPWDMHLGHGVEPWSNGQRWIHRQGLLWRIGQRNGTLAWWGQQQEVYAVSDRWYLKSMNGKYTHSLSYHIPINATPSLGSNDNQFLDAYPDADKSVTHLIRTIRQKTRRARSSKNGTPEARSSVSRSGSAESEWRKHARKTQLPWNDPRSRLDLILPRPSIIQHTMYIVFNLIHIQFNAWYRRFID